MSDIVSASSSRMARNTSKKVKNAQLTEYPSELESLNKWSIPDVPNKDIYKIGFFDYKSLIAIKTVERTASVDQEEQTIKLLGQEDIEPFMDRYKYIHIGLIQVAFRPLTLQGLNASLLACLRDARCLNWTQSLMGIMETSLCNGPVYFNVYPNLSLSLSDPNILEAVSLNIKTHGYEFLPGSETVAIIYRMHYKALTTLAPKAKVHTKPGKTVLVETNLLSSNIAVNRQIKWKEVNFPESWLLPNAVQPQPIMNQEIDQITQTVDGEVQVMFNPTRSVILTDIANSARRSVSRSDIGSSSRKSISRENEVKGLNISQNQIPHPIYTKEKEKLSPTNSEMSFHM